MHLVIQFYGKSSSLLDFIYLFPFLDKTTSLLSPAPPPVTFSQPPPVLIPFLPSFHIPPSPIQPHRPIPPTLINLPKIFNGPAYNNQTMTSVALHNHFSNYMKKRQGEARENPSRVLLVCVYDTVVLEINNQVIFARFSQFGFIIKILIFERGEVTKFFIEYAQLADAENAKNTLDGGKLYESICKMSIYYSNFRSVDLKHETTEGVSLEPFLQAAPEQYQYLLPTPYLMFDPSDSYSYPKGDAYFQPLLPITSVHNNTLSAGYSPAFLPQDKPYPGSGNPKSPPIHSLELSIESDIDWLLRSEQKKNQESQLSLRKESFNRKEVDSGCYMSFPLTCEMNIRNVYNLFSNFGNISFIKKTKKVIFVKFRSPEYAAMAQNYLEGYRLMGNTLALNVMVEIGDALPREDEYAEITYYDCSFDRFTPLKSITINPPSETLHISSLRRQICKSQELRYIFEEFGPIEGVEILSHNHDKNMALVKFENIEDSFAAISQMHNRMLSGRKIQISFTKSKLF